LRLRPVCQPSAWLGAGKNWLLQKKAGFLASFEMFSALRAGLAGEEMALILVSAVLRF
jgi:hypothetical protein